MEERRQRIQPRLPGSPLGGGLFLECVYYEGDPRTENHRRARALRLPYNSPTCRGYLLALPCPTGPNSDLESIGAIKPHVWVNR